MIIYMIAIYSSNSIANVSDGGKVSACRSQQPPPPPRDSFDNMNSCQSLLLLTKRDVPATGPTSQDFATDCRNRCRRKRR